MRLYSAFTCRSNRKSSTRSSITDLYESEYISPHDLAVLKQNFQFLRDENDDIEQGQTDWHIRMSVRYYQQLYREYALADLSRYQEGKIGLRWRTEREVIAGKGQFQCGNKDCHERTGLHSYELLFAYVEHGKKKQCMVKVRACSNCAEKLFYKKVQDMMRKENPQVEKSERKRRDVEKNVSNGKKDKRRRRLMSCGDLHKCAGNGVDDDASEWKEVQTGNDERHGGNDQRIHKLCAKINAEQNAAYPRHVSQHRDEFKELLL
ncbi:unnamed protein product [Peronospora belbahrii]|nr:unnamed protein product [Peronospora belbahrii]